EKEHWIGYSWHGGSENKAKDKCIDSHQEQGIEQRPYKTERRAPITGCQVASGQVLHQCRCLPPIAPDIRSPFKLVYRGEQLLSRGNCVRHSLSSTIRHAGPQALGKSTLGQYCCRTSAGWPSAITRPLSSQITRLHNVANVGNACETMSKAVPFCCIC